VGSSGCRAGLGGAEQLKQSGFDLRRDDLGTANHDTREFRRLRCERQRENPIRPLAWEQIKHAHAVFGEPRITPGIDHGLRFVGIETSTGERNLNLSAKLRLESCQIKTVPMFCRIIQ